MRTRLLFILMLGCWVAASSGPARAQSLGELARREKAKKESAPKAAKVYSNDNLPRTTSMEDSASATASSAPESSATAGARSESKPESRSSTSGQQEGSTRTEEKEPEDKKMTKEYWQAAFEAARADLARADEEMRLSQDELNLARMNETRELDPQVKSDLGQNVAAKQSEFDAKRAAQEKARQAWDDLVKKFEESGAPTDWMPPEEKQ